jgi:hypothetical protein
VDISLRPARYLGAALLCCLALAIVLVFKIGPVVLIATPEHGVHVGDFLAIPALGAAALNVRPALTRAFAPAAR